MRQLSLTDAAWVLLESRDTPMHVGGLFEFAAPDGASGDFLRGQLGRWLQRRDIPAPWNLKLVSAPLVGSRLPLMCEDHNLDLDYHVRRSALPHPGGQRELGDLVSRLHSNQLDLRRPLWEAHFIEGLEQDRFAMYMKVHHALIDGVSAVRLILESFSADPLARDAVPFWLVGDGVRSEQDAEGAVGAGQLIRWARSSADGAVKGVDGLGRAAVDLARARVDSRPLTAPYQSPACSLRRQLSGQRRIASQQYELAQIKELAKAGGCTLNDVVLWLCGTALRLYLAEHDHVPDQPLTAGIPVSIRSRGHDAAGTAIASMIADLGTDIADPRERLARIVASTSAAKQHLQALPAAALSPYLVVVNAPYIAGLTMGMGARSPVPFSVAVSNVPGPPMPLFLDGARLEAMFPVSLLTHGNALNITCVSYVGTLNFGFTGARDALPHLQRLALHMGAAKRELTAVLLEDTPVSAGSADRSRSS